MPSPEFVRPLLASFGYRLDVEPGPPATCRATLGAEAWSGSGATAEEAVDKLLHTMFPSSMAWDLFLEALHGGAAHERESTQRLPASPRPVAPSAVRIDVVDPPPSVRVRADFEAAVPSIARSSPERMRLAPVSEELCMARAAAALSTDAAAEAQGVLGAACSSWRRTASGAAARRASAATRGRSTIGAVRRGWSRADHVGRGGRHGAPRARGRRRSRPPRGSRRVRLGRHGVARSQAAEPGHAPRGGERRARRAARPRGRRGRGRRADAREAPRGSGPPHPVAARRDRPHRVGDRRRPRASRRDRHRSGRRRRRAAARSVVSPADDVGHARSLRAYPRAER